MIVFFEAVLENEDYEKAIGFHVEGEGMSINEAWRDAFMYVNEMAVYNEMILKSIQLCEEK